MQTTMATHSWTKTASDASEWAIDDDVVQLREWGTEKAHMLPQTPADECTVGAGEACGLRLDDPAQLVSRVHARLVRGETKWLLRDGGSKNGLRLDGVRRNEIVLEPGVEIGIGGITLIAESALSIELRGFLARLLGWGSMHTKTIDRALRSVRMAAARRVALVLCGDGDLTSVARSIHRRSRGADRPFVVCDPGRQPGMATVRSAESYTTGMEAVVAADGGSLCMRAQRLPPDFHELVHALHAPSSQVQLIACVETLEDCEVCRVMPIAIPLLATRGAELDRIIREYAEDARRELAVPRSEFPDADLAWVREHAGTSLPEIEKATLRLVALRASRSVSNAATRLGMAPVSLLRWIGRRRMPMKIVQ